MGREILFKAQRTDTKEWVKGCLLIDYVSGQYFIHALGNCLNESDKVGEEGCLKFFAYEVAPGTVCQYTGYKDDTGKRIFEGDIVAFEDMTSTESGYSEMDCCGKVGYDKEEACFYVTDRLSTESWEVLGECHIIGNIFDNPELLNQ